MMLVASAGLHPRGGGACRSWCASGLCSVQRNSHVQSVQPALVVALDRDGHPGGLVLGHVQRRGLALVQRLAQMELTDVPVRRCSMGAMLLLAWQAVVPTCMQRVLTSWCGSGPAACCVASLRPLEW